VCGNLSKENLYNHAIRKKNIDGGNGTKMTAFFGKECDKNKSVKTITGTVK